MNCFRGPDDDDALAAADPRGRLLPRRRAADPLPDHAEEPTFFNLSDDRASVPSPHGRTFPTALDPLFTNRYEIGAFAKEAYDLGINYLGVCCGASPMLIRETAEAVGRTHRGQPLLRERWRTISCTAPTTGCPNTSGPWAIGPERHQNLT